MKPLPMTAEELAQIRGRHQARFGSHGAAITASQCDLDRARLVREVDHLTAELDEARGEVERLDAANVGLAMESERLRMGLRFYAHGQHMVGFEAWDDGADPESPSWCCPPDDSSMMVEDGGCARLVLSGIEPDWDGDPPIEHICEPGIAEARSALAG